MRLRATNQFFILMQYQELKLIVTSKRKFILILATEIQFTIVHVCTIHILCRMYENNKEFLCRITILGILTVWLLL